MLKYGVLFITVCYNFVPILSSSGDQSIIHQNCLRNCILDNCTEVGDKFKYNEEFQDFWCRLFMWSCSDECKYQCMWQTVTAFEERFGLPPKFYGKWPFVRIMGAQEPVSAFASLINLVVHAYMYAKMRRLYSAKSTPLVHFWDAFAVVCMNAWVWSTIFHIKDTPFTEFMDYACALSMVVALFVAAVVRAFYGWRKLTLLILAYPLYYFVNHVIYLYSDRVDYEFNMRVNIYYGICGGIVWVVWCSYQYMAGMEYVWTLLEFITLTAATLALEVFDIPPLWRLLDTHAMWHISTSPAPLLFYKFVMDDLSRLKLRKYDKLTMKSA